MGTLRIRHFAAAALLLAVWAQPAAAGEPYGYHHRHHHHHGVKVTYGTPDYALPRGCCEPSIVRGPGLPTVVYGPPVFPDPTELEPAYLVDQVPTGTYPLGQFRDPALLHSPRTFPYVSAYAPYYYGPRRHRHRAHRDFDDYK